MLSRVISIPFIPTPSWSDESVISSLIHRNPYKLDGIRLKLHDVLLPIAELLAGRPNKTMPFDVLSAEELRLCFQRLRRSIKTLKDAGGRQVYLQHIERHTL